MLNLLLPSPLRHGARSAFDVLFVNGTGGQAGEIHTWWKAFPIERQEAGLLRARYRHMVRGSESGRMQSDFCRPLPPLARLRTRVRCESCLNKSRLLA